MSLVEYDDIKKLIRLYFKQPKVLYQHLFLSYNQLIEEIIPYSLVKENNYFHESPDKNYIYLHGFKCKNVRMKPVVFENNPNEIMFPDQARKNHLNYFQQYMLILSNLLKKEIYSQAKKQLKQFLNQPIMIQLQLQIYL